MTSASPSEGELARRWAAVHPGMTADAHPMVRNWLRLMWFLGRPLSTRGVSPNAVTVSGALLGPVAVGVALVSSRWLALLVLGLLLGGALADGLDGAVAILSDRTSGAGARLDRLADRLADACWALVLWAFGAPLWAAALLIAATLAQEAWRSSLGPAAAGLITVAERPTRLICASLGALCAVIAPAASWTASVCAAVWGVAALFALTQLAVRTARRR
ncbi:MAG: CDP-alcohol phosphatidyltransferase [Pseudonocardiales bacterium]|nr:CDP-alcohol phosphatidyltransferase [Pseudonocardiales bacterium]